MWIQSSNFWQVPDARSWAKMPWRQVGACIWKERWRIWDPTRTAKGRQCWGWGWCYQHLVIILLRVHPRLLVTPAVYPYPSYDQSYRFCQRVPIELWCLARNWLQVGLDRVGGLASGLASVGQLGSSGRNFRVNEARFDVNQLTLRRRRGGCWDVKRELTLISGVHRHLLFLILFDLLETSLGLHGDDLDTLVSYGSVGIPWRSSFSTPSFGYHGSVAALFLDPESMLLEKIAETWRNFGHYPRLAT